MAGPSWFVAINGKQEGPYSETEFRDLLANGVVNAETLVWSEGMTNWQRAADIPGLLAGGGRAAAPPMPGSGAAPRGTLSVDFPLLPFIGYGLLYIIGFVFVIPAPWTATAFYRWAIPFVQVPQRPNLSFTGKPGDIWYAFILMGLANIASSYSDESYMLVGSIVVQAVMSWFIIRWLVSNIASDGRPLGLSFSGEWWQYLGWYLFLIVSIITIIGWAWVTTAWGRWMCARIEGTRRPVYFNASGFELLWRSLVTGFASAFVIPIPWVVRWYARWIASQVSVGEPTS